MLFRFFVLCENVFTRFICRYSVSCSFYFPKQGIFCFTSEHYRLSESFVQTAVFFLLLISLQPFCVG